jgi:hypothetical protein
MCVYGKGNVLLWWDLWEILRVGDCGGMQRYGSQDDRICTVTVALDRMTGRGRFRWYSFDDKTRGYVWLLVQHASNNPIQTIVFCQKILYNKNINPNYYHNK